jgi:hypothetical protein
MSAPGGPLRQARVCIRFPFDIGFPPPMPAPVPFVADGNAQPPGGPGFTVQGTIFDLAGAVAQSNTLVVNFMQGVWSMGPFTQIGTANPMLPGDYVLRVRLMQGPVQRDVHEVTIRIM